MKKLARRLLMGCLGTALSIPALAQQPAPAPEPPAPASEPAPAPEPAATTAPAAEEPAAAEAPPPAATPAPAAEGPVEQIVVTGSAIRRRDLITPAPVSILDRIDLDASGSVSLGEILQRIPEQGNGINVQFNNGGDGSTRLNLRSLGVSRTLVLLNGRRFVNSGTGADPSVDLNAIPQAIIERVEVLKDGASAIYGSDAVSGVVNLITRKRFQGTEGMAYTGITSHGDAFTYDISATSGLASSKGGVLFSVGYYKQDDLFSSARPWADIPISATSYDWDTGVLTPQGSSAIPQGRFSVQSDACTAAGLKCTGNAKYQQLISMFPSAGTFVHDPTAALGWRPYNPNGLSDQGTGDTYNFAPVNYLITPQQRYNIFSSGDYDFSDNIRGYFEASYMNRESAQLLAPEPVFTSSLPNPELPPIITSADNIYNPFGRDFIDMRRRITETGGRHFTQDIDTFRTVVGVDGSIPGTDKNWNWNLDFNFGRSTASATVEGQFIVSHLRNALGPSFKDAGGQAHCGTPDNVIQGCVPMDFFDGPGTITQDMLNYVSYVGTQRGSNEQKIIEGSVSGKLFDIPGGGPVGVAAGAQFDREDAQFTPDPFQAAGDNLDGSVAPTGGGYNVFAGFMEVDATLLQHMTGVDKLELTGAVRAGNYNTFGGFVTGKGGVRWQVIPDFAIRGTISNAFRAPNVADLFAGAATGFPGVSDPCGDPSQPRPAHCDTEGLPANFADDRTQLPTTFSGNANLQPEKATTITGGIVFTPTFFKGFSVTLDYFRINIDDLIINETAPIILNNCYTLGIQSDCDKVHRDPATHEITNITDPNQNIGNFKTAGLDFDVAYRFRVNKIGNIRMNVEGTWLQQFEETIAGNKIDGLNTFDLGGTNPSIKFNANLQWANAGWSAGAGARFVGPWHECENNDCSAASMNPSRDIDPYVIFNAFVSKDFKSPLGTTGFTIGVLNIADKDPPALYNGLPPTNSDAGTYDYLGRFFYARLSQRF